MAPTSNSVKKEKVIRVVLGSCRIDSLKPTLMVVPKTSLKKVKCFVTVIPRCASDNLTTYK